MLTIQRLLRLRSARARLEPFGECAFTRRKIGAAAGGTHQSRHLRGLSGCVHVSIRFLLATASILATIAANAAFEHKSDVQGSGEHPLHEQRRGQTQPAEPFIECSLRDPERSAAL